VAQQSTTKSAKNTRKHPGVGAGPTGGGRGARVLLWPVRTLDKGPHFCKCAIKLSARILKKKKIWGHAGGLGRIYVIFWEYFEVVERATEF
jgi:hypothetical protein